MSIWRIASFGHNSRVLSPAIKSFAWQNSLSTTCTSGVCPAEPLVPIAAGRQQSESSSPPTCICDGTVERSMAPLNERLARLCFDITL